MSKNVEEIFNFVKNNTADGAAAVSFTSIPAAKQAAKMIKRRAMGIVEIKQEMLSFCKANTDEYEVTRFPARLVVGY
ncbi:hypothetical protein EB796_010568 [Bugula neritina]|uniref:Uncharacterized protein n=1 Tax=Bugula neritina TaxID=10212 RepID=A0A7J7JXK8_BUGNE|nr:hypothetical protein EB796_010568 [Bugula neritina]